MDGCCSSFISYFLDNHKVYRTRMLSPFRLSPDGQALELNSQRPTLGSDSKASGYKNTAQHRVEYTLLQSPGGLGKPTHALIIGPGRPSRPRHWRVVQQLKLKRGFQPQRFRHETQLPPAPSCCGRRGTTRNPVGPCHHSRDCRTNLNLQDFAIRLVTQKDHYLRSRTFQPRQVGKVSPTEEFGYTCLYSIILRRSIGDQLYWYPLRGSTDQPTPIISCFCPYPEH